MSRRRKPGLDVAPPPLPPLPPPKRQPSTMSTSKSNEVVIFYVPDAKPWCEYLTGLIKKNKETRIKSMDLEELEYENPPEVAQSVQESYLVILLASPNMLTYMKDKSWFSESLCKVPDKTTVVVALCFVDSAEFQESVGDTYRAASSWKHYVMSNNQKENIHSVADMLDIVDKNESVPERPISRPPKPRSKRKESSANLRVIPTRVHAPHCDVVIAFKDEIKGTIQITLTDSHRTTSSTDSPTKIDTKKLNPYTHKFKAPEKAPGNYILHVYNDAKEIYKSPFYYVAPRETSFTSVEYLSQALQCENTTALDRKLVDILERSIPEDESLSVLFSKLKGDLASGIPKSKSEYPTLLHFAAASGLSDFCALLLDVPGSLVAFQIENCDGKDPADLADIYNHPELAQYIRDFMATSYLADTCELYMAMTGGYRNVDGPEPVSEDLYMAMGGGVRPVTVPEEDEPECPYTTTTLEPPPPLQPRASRLPPVPRKPPTRQSADAAVPPSYHAPPPPSGSLARAQSERKQLPPHTLVEKKSLTLPPGLSASKIMGMMETEIGLPKTAMGSSSQNELLDIMNGVKEGNFNPNEALMLFKAWQERNRDGQTRSFKDRQKTLKIMREDYSSMINNLEKSADQMAGNKPGFFTRLISKRKNPSQRQPQISNPILHRNTSRTTTVPSYIKNEPRLSNISTTSSSSSSSRESTSSMSVDPGDSSDDSDSGIGGGVRSRRHISSTSSFEGDSYKRQSRKLDFLAETDDWEEQPPLPPRTYTRSNMPRPTPRPRPAMPTPRT